MANEEEAVGGEPRIRGVPLLSFLSALRALGGYDAVTRTVGALPADLRDAIRYRRITTQGWFPLAWYRALHGAAQRATGLSRGLAKLIGRETMRADMSGIFRVFLLVISPQALIAKAPKVYEQYFDTGSLAVAESRAGSATLRWQGCQGFDQNIWDDMIGSVEAGIELAGGKEVRVELTSGGGDGDTDAVMVMRWT